MFFVELCEYHAKISSDIRIYSKKLHGFFQVRRIDADNVNARRYYISLVYDSIISASSVLFVLGERIIHFSLSL